MMRKKHHRRVKSCRNCKYFEKFDYLHCGLGLRVDHKIVDGVIKSTPEDYQECIDMRNFQHNHVGFLEWHNKRELERV